MPRERMVALVSPQGTACTETGLSVREDTPERRARVEAQFCRGGKNDPLPGTWADVTENDAFYDDE